MVNENEVLVRSAYEAYAAGDVATMMRVVDADLEWTYLDPAFEDPEPQVCHGSKELRVALERQTRRGLKSRLEDVHANGDRVMVAVHTPGIEPSVLGRPPTATTTCSRFVTDGSLRCAPAVTEMKRCRSWASAIPDLSG